MIYTLGNPELYDEMLSAGPMMKQGSRHYYKGGSVFRTLDAARPVAERYNFAVYSIEAKWETDVQMTDPDCGHLLVDARILGRCE